MTNKTMTKEQAFKQFKNDHENFLKQFRTDNIAKMEAWSNYTDYLMKDGLITEKQYDTWSNPYQK